MTDLIDQAVLVLNQGGVIAYPTEHCFGLGCDPSNQKAVLRILDIKHRSIDQGLLLIAADLDQVREYAQPDASPIYEQILESWPGHVTWTLPANTNVPEWIKGKHHSVAMRVTAHALSSSICRQYGRAIVSTSANRHTQAALLTSDQVETEMGSEVDYIVTADVGDAKQASQIRDGVTGHVLR